jgi:glycosyltransferase involved in cell wall biosynthesis
MKKNLLFVMPGLAAGGGEKSLVNLLSQINYDLYNVDLFLLDHNGLFMDYVPSEVNVVALPETYRIFALPFWESIKALFLRRKVTLLYNRILFAAKNRMATGISKKEQYNWKYIAMSLDQIEKKYDAAIGFLEKTSIYFCVDKVHASQKIGWIHIDYDKLGMDPAIDLAYFRKLNHIVTVSEECAKILKNRFPTQKNKVDIIYNIVSPKMIKKMATQDERNLYNKKGDEIIILSIGRLHYQKGFEAAIESCKKLKEKGYNIKWNIIGEGEEREKLTQLIKVNELENDVKLLGLKSNPYPYIKQADLYVQTSKFEGKSIAIDEAKILNKPIVVTNFSTAKDQIHHGIDGLIVDMNADAIAQGIEKLITDVNLRKKLIFNLSQSKLGTEEEIEKLYKLIN